MVGWRTCAVLTSKDPATSRQVRQKTDPTAHDLEWQCTIHTDGCDKMIPQRGCNWQYLQSELVKRDHIRHWGSEMIRCNQTSVEVTCQWDLIWKSRPKSDSNNLTLLVGLELQGQSWHRHYYLKQTPVNWNNAPERLVLVIWSRDGIMWEYLNAWRLTRSFQYCKYYECVRLLLEIIRTIAIATPYWSYIHCLHSGMVFGC